PLVRMAISVASPTLTDAIDHPPRGEKGARALRSSVLRYRIRMATRPTPFGLFGGVAIARWGDVSDVRIAPGPRPTRTRLDTGWLIDVVLAVEQDPALREHLYLVANTCIFRRDDRLYLTERATCGHAGQPDVSVRATPAVCRLLELAREPTAHRDL